MSTQEEKLGISTAPLIVIELLYIVVFVIVDVAVIVVVVVNVRKTLLSSSLDLLLLLLLLLLLSAREKGENLGKPPALSSPLIVAVLPRVVPGRRRLDALAHLRVQRVLQIAFPFLQLRNIVIRQRTMQGGRALVFIQNKIKGGR